MVHAPDRDAAIDRLRRALDETEIGGVQTTLPFHRVVARSSAFRAGDLSTGWVDAALGRRRRARRRAVRRALLAAGLAAIADDPEPAGMAASDALPWDGGPRRRPRRLAAGQSHAGESTDGRDDEGGASRRTG